ncbi:MAG: hypothetical protein A2064_00570 [Spirochaetes bacterium GWB1_66_5]|nr:MAG: hypothetical protein A2064_00570 [Spirochaetes bacterium GWB1_66_5]
MSRRRVAAPWGNRVVGTGTVPAGQLLANPGNWRIHPDVQADQLGAVLGAVGFVQTVIVNRRSSPAWGKDRHVETLVDGHLRVHLALARGEETPVPVSYVDLKPAEERLILAVFDPLSALAGRDDEKLASLREEVLVDLPDWTGIDLGAILDRERRGGRKHVEFSAKMTVCPACGHEW